MTPELLLQSTVLGLSIGAIYILMALGLTLMFGMMHIINFAHGAIYMLGAFAVYYLFAQAGFPYVFAFLLTLVLLGVFGLIIERVVYRTLGGEIEATLVALLALTTLLESAGYLVFGVLDKDVPTVFPGVIHVGGINLSVERLITIPIAAVLVLALHLFMQKTRIGQAMRAIEQDKEAAALQGVNVNHINALAFGVGFALAAGAGALIAPVFAVNPSMGEIPLLKAFIIIILGGLGSIPGAILGGVILGLIDGLLATAFGFEIAFLLSFVLIILILLVKPQGLLGHA
jgi:branched-chain amino acid transport system permease protein